MGVGTLLRYLTGDRRAILELASAPRALWLGLLFVLSAGFAREYDGEDLLAEPWHLLLPLGASLLSASVLFALTYGKVLRADPARPPLPAAYRSFLALFWLTAPLAWLYAVPYERFLTPAGAVAANLWTLGLVAAWRVALMARVVSVLLGYGAWSAVALVMAFADAAALLALYLAPLPVVSIMGGVRLTEGERLIQGVSLNVAVLGVLTAPVWGLGALAALAGGRPAWQVPPGARGQGAAPGRVLWALAGASVAVWALVLPWTQPEQRLRRRVEQDLRGGRAAEALAVMSAHAPGDFPPHWDPPPRVGYGESSPPLLDVMDLVADEPPAPWVRAVYVGKLRRYLGDRFRLFHLPRGEAARVVRLLRRLPEGPALAAEHEGDLLELLHSAPDPTEQDREALRPLVGEEARGSTRRRPE